MFRDQHDPSCELFSEPEDSLDRRPGAFPRVEESAIWDLANKVCDRYFRSPPNAGQGRSDPCVTHRKWSPALKKPRRELSIESVGPSNSAEADALAREATDLRVPRLLQLRRPESAGFLAGS